MGDVMRPVKSRIEGVEIHPLKQIENGRGALLHMLRVDSPLFSQFGEIYFSEILPGAVKAWKYHKKMTQLFTVPVGKVKLVIYDNRPNSLTQGKLIELDIGRDNYHLIKLPPKLMYGFKCISPHSALIANCADLPHSPEEAINRDINESTIPYTW
jgi:dTDP-4-dehydrorhamnose 3,5-epimerase